MTTPAEPDAGLSRATAVALAERMQVIYTRVEARLAADIARRLRQGIESPEWAQRKLEAVGQLRRWTRTLLERANREADDEITQALLLAYMRGSEEAVKVIAGLQDSLPEWLNRADIDDPSPRIRQALKSSRRERDRQLAQISRGFPGLRNLMQIIRSLVYRIRGVNLPVLRWTEDAYREVIAAGALPDVSLGVSTRLRASQVAWEELLSQGIKGFTDKSGRQWNLATYVEMATRTGVVQASVEGHLDRLAAAGLDYVIVSNAPQECEKCRPWEGKILATRGAPGPRVARMESAIADEMVPVAVAGTVAEAILAGLMHPNCRHRFGVYLPGVTRIPTNTEDPEGDAAQQKLRGLERKVRKNKLLAETAFTPIAKRGYEVKVRALQAQIREHVKASKHLGIVRKPEREQIHAAR